MMNKWNYFLGRVRTLNKIIHRKYPCLENTCIILFSGKASRGASYLGRTMQEWAKWSSALCPSAMLTSVPEFLIAPLVEHALWASDSELSTRSLPAQETKNSYLIGSVGSVSGNLLKHALERPKVEWQFHYSISLHSFFSHGLINFREFCKLGCFWEEQQQLRRGWKSHFRLFSPVTSGVKGLSKCFNKSCICARSDVLPTYRTTDI